MARGRHPGGVLPYKGTCGQPGYVFRDFCLKQGIDRRGGSPTCH